MSKVLILYPDYDIVFTGGHIYDHLFLDRVAASKKHSIDFIKYTSSLFGALSLFSTVKKYNVVITNSRLYTSYILLWLMLRLFSKCKLLCIHHHFDFMNYPSKKNGGNTGRFLIERPVRYTAENLFLLFCTAVVIPSPYVRDVFRRIFPHKKFFYVELGLLPAFSQNIIPQSNILQGKTGKDLIYVGTVYKRKGLHILIDALSIIDRQGIDFNCTLVGAIRGGKSGYKEFIDEKIKTYKLGNKISFTGKLSDEELASRYNNASIFVFPSLLEGYGMVLLEAMAYGLPVVAFNNSAMPYTVKDGINGLLCKNADSADFACKLAALLKDGSLQQRLSRGALQSASTKRKMTDMYPDIDKFIQWL